MAQEKTRVVRVHNDNAPLNSRIWWCGDRGSIPDTGALETKVSDAPADRPFAVPMFVGAEFAALRGYWNSLRRGNAVVPFTDDFKPAALGKLAGTVALIRVFQNPQRFRFDLVGRSVAGCYGEELENRFADALPARIPLEFLLAQCSATVESAAPTFYYGACSDGTGEYQRLMLPLWSDGRVDAILAAIELGHGGADVV